LLSLPWAGSAAGPATPQEREKAVRDEAAAFRESPERPTFAANEFFFQSGSSAPGVPFYSGLYLDLGGQGIVATLMAPWPDLGGGERGVVAADLAFDIDWSAFAAGIDAALPAPAGHPVSWTDLQARLGSVPPRSPARAGSLSPLASAVAGSPLAAAVAAV